MYRPPYITRDDLLSSLYRFKLDTPLVLKALQISSGIHKDQIRDGGTPYLEEHIFPITKQIAVRHTKRSDIEELIIIALLHDAVEDSLHLSVESIRKEFGESVAIGIQYLTKRKRGKCRAKTAEEKFARNYAHLKRIEKGGERTVIVKLEDRINNYQSTTADRIPLKLEKHLRYIREGEAFYLPLTDRITCGVNYRGELEKELVRLKRLCLQIKESDTTEKSTAASQFDFNDRKNYN